MAQSIISAKSTKGADAVIISAPYEKTASSHKGTVAGPKAVVGMLSTQVEFFDRTYKCEVNSKIAIAHKDLKGIEKLSPEATLKKITSACAEVVLAGQFPFLLGGEHSVSIGMFAALSKKYAPKDVTILQIDAHCDLREDDSDYSDTPSTLAHSTVMRHASTMGYPLVQVGIRTYSTDEYKYFSNKKNNVTVFEWGNGKKVPAIAEILKFIKTKYLYISIDVDGFDPAHMPGTGTAVQGGLEWWYGVELLEKAIKAKQMVGADIVEVSPVKDSVLTEYGAAQLCYTMLANIFRNKLK